MRAKLIEKVRPDPLGSRDPLDPSGEVLCGACLPDETFFKLALEIVRP